jgi:hypothetical protein
MRRGGKERTVLEIKFQLWVVGVGEVASANWERSL